MDHKTLDELRSLLGTAENKVSVGSKYHHYKDPSKFYRVTGLSIMEATNEVAVRYAMVDNLDIEFVRTLSIWLETVDWNGQNVPRFTKVG